MVANRERSMGGAQYRQIPWQAGYEVPYKIEELSVGSITYPIQHFVICALLEEDDVSSSLRRVKATFWIL